LAEHLRYALGVTRVLACLSLFFFLVPVTYVHGPKPPKNNSQIINLLPIKLHADDPKRSKVGRLEFLAGWKMSSDNADFGGISSMLVMDGDRARNRFFMLTDAGVMIGFTLDEDNSKAKRPFIAPLPDGPPVENEFAQKNWDAESILHDPETGQFWVGYERYHGVWRYGPSLARKESEQKIKAMQKWPENGGAEAMLRLEDDRFLVFSESADYKKGGYQALSFAGDPSMEGTPSKLFGYKPPKGYQLTDAVILDDGQALLLHRRFTPLDGVSAIISLGDLSKIKTGKVWESKQIASLKPPLRVDNMEALAVTMEGDDTIIWIASDDNFNAVQESILMKFRLLKGKEKRKKKPDSIEPGFSSLDDPEVETSK